MEIGPDGVRPIDWHARRRQVRHRQTMASCTSTGRRNAVTGEIEGETIELPLEPGLQDRSSMQIAVVDVACCAA